MFALPDNRVPAQPRTISSWLLIVLIFYDARAYQFLDVGNTSVQSMKRIHLVQSHGHHFILRGFPRTVSPAIRILASVCACNRRTHFVDGHQGHVKSSKKKMEELKRLSSILATSQSRARSCTFSFRWRERERELNTTTRRLSQCTFTGRRCALIIEHIGAREFCKSSIFSPSANNFAFRSFSRR